MRAKTHNERLVMLLDHVKVTVTFPNEFRECPFVDRVRIERLVQRGRDKGFEIQPTAEVHARIRGISPPAKDFFVEFKQERTHP